MENFTPSSSALQTALHRASEYFAQQGAGAVEAQKWAAALLGQMAERQSTLLAYIDVSYICAIAALMVPLVLLLLRPVDRQAAAGGD